MSTPTRTIKNLLKIGPRAAGRQMQYIGDTKAGTHVGTDRWGNKYYENLEEELPLRTRWVDYRMAEYDPAVIEPGWHAWMSYMVHDPPNRDALLKRPVRVWEPAEVKPNYTATRGAFTTYSTTKSKIAAWQPKTAPR